MGRKAPISIHQDNESSLHDSQYTCVCTDMMMHKILGKTVQPITKGNYTYIISILLLVNFVSM
jgi:hypothetical protein